MAIVGIASMLTPNTAEAACESPLTSPCLNSENLWPHAGASRFSSIGGTEMAPEGQVGFGLLMSYSSRPLVLEVPSPGPGGSRQNAIDNQLSANFLWHLGITSRLQAEFVAPVTLGQSGAGLSPITAGSTGLKSVAMRDIRFGLAYSLLPKARVDVATESASPKAKGHTYGLAARVEFSAPTGADSELARDRTAVFTPSMVGDYRRDRFFAAIELGARIRAVSQLAGTRIGTQLVASLGAGYDILDGERLSALVEVRHLIGFAEQNDTTQTASGILSQGNGKYIVPAEWAVSARSGSLFGGDFSFNVGGGAAIPYGADAAATSPRFRFTFGIRYAPLERDSDGDGIPDKRDLCPHEKEVPVEGAIRDGCPDLPVAPPVATEPVNFDSAAAAVVIPAAPVPAAPLPATPAAVGPDAPATP